MNSIRLAALLGHEYSLQLLLQLTECYEINESDDDGRTALLWASQLGYNKVVQVLLDKGADVNAKGGRYGIALEAASAGGHEMVVQILLEKGADVNADGGRYRNALQVAPGGGQSGNHALRAYQRQLMRLEGQHKKRLARQEQRHHC
jgi:ankyrin repeat protein